MARNRQVIIEKAKARQPVERSCAICGASFLASYTTRTGAIGKTRKLYCSSKCANEALQRSKRINQATRDALRKKDGVCVVCGKAFWILPSTGNKQRYCSKKCQHQAAKTIEAICSRCGKVFHHERSAKGRFCSLLCHTQNEKERFELQRKQTEQKAIEARRVFRHNAALRLKAFRVCKNAAEVARQFGEPETTTHNFIDKCRGYKRIQSHRTKESNWRKAKTRCGRLSALFPKEKTFCNHIERLLIAKSITFIREAPVPGPTGRRTDFVMTDLFRVWVVEAKNSSHTSDVDCCLGQAISRAIAFRGVPVIALPSDLEVDDTTQQACKALGVVIVNETNIVKKWLEYGA